MQLKDYLTRRLSEISAKQTTTNKANIFKNTQLAQSSVFSASDLGDFKNIDFEQLLNSDLSELNAGLTDENQIKLNSIMKGFLSLEGVQTAADLDGDGVMSADEAKSFVMNTANADGNNKTLSLGDIQAVLDDIDINLVEVAENSVDEAVKELIDSLRDNDGLKELPGQKDKDSDKVEDEDDEDGIEVGKKPVDTDKTEEEEKAKAAEQAQQASASQGSSSAGGGGSSSGGGGVSGSSSGSSSAAATQKSGGLDNMSLDELKTERSNRQKTLEEKQKAVNAVHNGENEQVKAAQDDLKEKKEAYEKALKEDKKVPEELKNKQTKNIQDIEKNDADLDKNAIEINDAEAKKSSQEATVTSLEGNLSALKGSLSALPASTGDEKKDQEIANKKASIEAQITEKQKELDTANKELDETKKKLEELNSKKEELEKKKGELEAQKTEIQAEIEKKCSEETKKAMTEYNEAKTNVQTVKQSELSTAQSEVTSAQAAVQEIDKKITEAETKKIEKENKVSSASLPEGIMKQDGVLYGKEDVIAEVAEKYGLEPEFFAAIISLESGYGTSGYAKNNYNFGGVTGEGDAGYTVRSSDGYKFAKYSSIEKGLDAMASNLASYDSRFDNVNSVDIDNVYQIASHYCPNPEEHWADKVSEIYNRIKSMS